MRYESRNIYSITVGNSPNNLTNLVASALNNNPLGVLGQKYHTVHADNTISENNATGGTSVKYTGETASLMVYDPDAESLASDALSNTQELPAQSQRLSILSYDENSGTLSILDSSDNALADSCTLPTAATLKLSNIALAMSNLAKNALTPL